MCPCVSKIFSGVTLSWAIASRCARQSPPGSTIAARLVAVQATIEQFCANGVTGTMVTFRACMGAFRAARRSPLYRKPVLLREGLERGLRAARRGAGSLRPPRARRVAPQSDASWPRESPVRNPAANRSPAPVASTSLSIGAAGTASLLSRETTTQPFLAARHHRKLDVVAQRADAVSKSAVSYRLFSSASLAKIRSTAPVRIRLRNSSR